MPTRTKPPAWDGPLVLRTLGAVALEGRNGSGETTVVLGPGKPLALLTYLALSPGRTVSREHLIDLLWSDLEPERGKHALRQTVYFIRSQLGEDALGGRAGELVLCAPIVTDRDGFVAAIEEGDLERGAQLYTGPFLPGFAAPGGAEFEHWADLERERLRGVFVRAAESLARRHLGTSSFREAQRLARRARDEDPLDESNWRLLIETLVAAGDHLTAAIEADALSALLQEEGRAPEPATRAAMRMARQRPEVLQPEPRRGLATELIGREAEFATIIRAWDAARTGHPRHIHVSAPAGLGKTRLLNDVHGRLRAGGVQVVTLRANPADRRISYLLAGELARALGTLPGAAAVSPAAASALVALHPGLSSHFTAPMDHSSGDEALRRRTMALSELVAAVSDEAPLALLIDDVHWCDAMSVQTLVGVIERLGTSRVLVVTTARSVRDDNVATSAANRLVLEPLSVQQVGVLLASLGAFPAEDWTSAFVEALHSTTGGSPLLVLETLQLAIDRQSLELTDGRWSCRDPVFLITEFQAGGALRHRIAQLDAASRDLLVLLATAGAPLPLARVARAARQTAEETESRLGSLERRGFVIRSRNEWEPTHDQIAEIAVETAPRAAVDAAHAALGRVLASDAEFDQRLFPRAAHHLLAAHDNAELDRLFSQWVDLARARGDHRPALALATDLLGAEADPLRVRRLVHALPAARRTQTVSWKGVVAMVSLVLIAGSVTISALDEGVLDQPAGIELLAMTPAGTDSVRVIRAVVDPRAVATGEPIVLHEQRTAGVFGQWSRVVGEPVLSPDGSRWAYALATADDGVVDLFVTRPDGSDVRLTAAAGADASPSWSPDGHHLVFATRRWSSAAGTGGDIATMEIARRRVRRLTRGETDDHSPRWSPDGTRIAFARQYDDGTGNEICWVSTRGGRQRCRPVAFDVLELLAWQGTTHVLVLGDDGDSQLLAHVPLEGGEPAVIVRGPITQAAATANGLWVTCLCRRSGDPAPTWYVFAANTPQVARRVAVETSAVPVMLDWGRVPGPSRFVTQFEIARPDRPISADATYRLRWVARDSSGRPVPVPGSVLRWHSSNPSVAEIDTIRGVVRPHRVGEVEIHATAGGWRSDSIVLTIAAPGARALLHEDWSDDSLERWSLFGSPRPRLVRGPRGTRAMLTGGDGIFRSGAYSREQFPAGGGLGVEAHLSTPADGSRLQDLTVALTATLDSAALETWDHVTGDPPGNRLEQLRSCSITYPGGAGATTPRLLLNAAAITGRVPLPERAAPSDWYTVRLQIFPDGTCGVAVNGLPLWRSEASLPTSERYRLELSGNTVGAAMLVGPMEIWDGVKGGVDWTVLE